MAKFVVRADRTVFLILGLALIVSLTVLIELRDGPCLEFYRWPETDMYFSDEWAKSISAGDWLNRKALHPDTEWQKDLATSVLAIKRPDLRPEDLKSGEPQRALWQSWYTPNAFHQEPLYVYMLAVIYRIVGPNIWVIDVWQMLLGLLAVYLVFDLAQRHFGRTVAIMSGLGAALCAPLIFYQIQLLRESLLVLAALILVRIAEWTVEKDTPFTYAAIGFACGLATMAKGIFATYPLFACGILFLPRLKTPRLVAVRLLAGAAGVILAISPLMIRNGIVGAPVTSLASQQTFSIAAANCDDYSHGALSAHLGEILYDSHGNFFTAWKMSLATHPNWLSVASMYINKFLRVWHWTEIPDNSSLAYFQLHSVLLRILPARWDLIAPLGLIGIAIALIRRRSEGPTLWPLLLMIFCIAFSMTLFTTNSRYRAPLVALLLPFACFTLIRAWEWISTRNWRPLAATASGLVVLIAVLSSVPSTDPLRPSDIVAGIQYYYMPRYERAVDAGDFPQAVQIVDDVYRDEPPWIRDMGIKRMPQNDSEIEMARTFCEVRRWRADALERAGLREQALAARTDLARLIAALSTKTQPVQP